MQVRCCKIDGQSKKTAITVGDVRAAIAGLDDALPMWFFTEAVVFRDVDYLRSATKDARRDAALLKLWLWLRNRAEKMGITVTLSTTEMKPRLGRANAKKHIGVYMSDCYVISLVPGHWLNPWLLAHEVGHHMAYKTVGKKHKEVSANDEGRKLVLESIQDHPILGACLPRHDMDVWLPARKHPIRKRRQRS